MGRSFVWAVVVLGSTVSIFAATVALRNVRTMAPRAEQELVLLCLLAVVTAWVLCHTTYTVRYAHLYYRDDGDLGGLGFPGTEMPCLLDFAYYAFTIGMCFQVSDVSVTQHRMRQATLGTRCSRSCSTRWSWRSPESPLRAADAGLLSGGAAPAGHPAADMGAPGRRRRPQQAVAPPRRMVQWCRATLGSSGTPMTALLASLLLAASPPLVQFETYTLPNGLTRHPHEDHRLPTVGREPLVPRRRREREAGPHRLRAPLRAPDVPGLEAPPGNDAGLRRLLEARGRLGPQRHHQQRPHQLLRDRARATASSSRCGWRATAWRYLLDALDQEKLDTQRDVVHNERRQSVREPALRQGRAPARASCSIPKPHPYYGAVIGSHEDLAGRHARRREGVLPHLLRARRTRRWSSPATSIRRRRKPLVEKYFGPHPAEPEGRPRPRSTTRPHRSRRCARRSPTTSQLPRIFVGVIAPPAWSDDGFAYDLAQEILAGGKTSRLYRALVFDRQLAQEVDMATDKSTFGSASESG